MARFRSSIAPPAEKPAKSSQRPSNADRSSYFARREAAKVLKSVLQGDARRRAVASIKSLVYSPSVRNKKGTFALVCQTLKHLAILKEVLEGANILNGKWKRQEELMYIITYDILFGQVQKDDMVPDLLVLPSGTDLHDHPLVKNGSIFMQGKASSMVAVALRPQPDWEVLDACSAPGNKTVHLAALMRGKGKITACELNKDRADV